MIPLMRDQFTHLMDPPLPGAKEFGLYRAPESNEMAVVYNNSVIKITKLLLKPTGIILTEDLRFSKRLKQKKIEKPPLISRKKGGFFLYQGIGVMTKI
ncbi:hypothetical protein J2T13_004656 [Paenibacillus sp. DS2015]